MTERLHRQVLPRLRGYVNHRGYLSLGHLGYAVAALQGSEVHLTEIRAFVEQCGVPVVPSRAHHNVRNLPLPAIERAKCLFGDLLRGEPDEQLVIERLGYADVPLTVGTRAFLMQAWMGHCLSRSEERQHAETIASEVTQVGTDWLYWSAQARASREALIIDNLWHVARIARRAMGRGMEVDDLHQAGSIGLFRAVVKFDPSLGYRFSTYAGQWIFQSMQRYLADQGRLIRIPVHVQGHQKAVRETAERLYSQTGRWSSPEGVAHACGVSPVAARALMVTGRPASLDRCDHQRMIGQIEADQNLETFAPISAAELAQDVADVLQRLPEREARVLELRYGLGDGRERTLEEVGREFGVTRERIRQIEAKGLKKLRHPSRTKKLRDHLDFSIEQALPAVSPTALLAVLPRFQPPDREVLAAELKHSEDASETRVQSSYARQLVRQAVRIVLHMQRNSRPERQEASSKPMAQSRRVHDGWNSAFQNGVYVPPILRTANGNATVANLKVGERDHRPCRAKRSELDRLLDQLDGVDAPRKVAALVPSPHSLSDQKLHVMDRTQSEQSSTSADNVEETEPADGDLRVNSACPAVESAHCIDTLSSKGFLPEDRRVPAHHELQPILARLNTAQLLIADALYGLTTGYPASPAEVSAKIGVSSSAVYAADETIRRLLARADDLNEQISSPRLAPELKESASQFSVSTRRTTHVGDGPGTDFEEKAGHALANVGASLFPKHAERVAHHVKVHVWRDSNYVGVNMHGAVSAWRGRSLNLGDFDERGGALYLDQVCNDLHREDRKRLFGPDFVEAIERFDRYVVLFSAGFSVEDAEKLLEGGFVPRVMARSVHACRIYSMPEFLDLPIEEISEDAARLVQLKVSSQAVAAWC